MDVAFAIIAAVIVVSAIAALSLRNLVHCALCLTVTFAGLAATYLKLDAAFVGFAQILVYIGAVAILIVFAILLTRGNEQTPGKSAVAGSWWVGPAIALLVFATLASAIVQSRFIQRPATETPTLIVKEIGDKLMVDYILPLEVIGLLLTAAMIGAAVIAMQEKK
jgi:NADH:ubiquinone oxidoreductase subunit 6 (subunit J)